MTPYDLLVAFLHPSGVRKGSLLSYQEDSLLRTLDGYDRAAVARDPSLIYDPSHIRDASDEALERAFRSLEFMLGGYDSVNAHAAEIEAELAS